MNRLKSIFISLAITVWAYFTFIAFQFIYTQTFSINSIGLFLISAIPLGFFIVLLSLKPVARTTKSLSYLTALIIIGTLLILAGTIRETMPLYFNYLAITSISLWLIYVYWYSTMPNKRGNLIIGNTLPPLHFIDGKNNQISTSTFKGKKMLLLFYRGNWCPLCMAQIKEISEEYKELEKRGVEVLLISPQPVSHSVSLANKMKVSFHFLTDKNNGMAKELGIDHPNGTPLGMEIFGYKSETVLPTAIITDKEGEIIFIDKTDNYRIRPEPSTFLAVLDKFENEVIKVTQST